MKNLIGKISSEKGIYSYYHIETTTCKFCTNKTWFGWTNNDWRKSDYPVHPICFKCEYDSGHDFWMVKGSKNDPDEITNQVMTLLKKYIEDHPEVGLEI